MNVYISDLDPDPGPLREEGDELDVIKGTEAERGAFPVIGVNRIGSNAEVGGTAQHDTLIFKRLHPSLFPVTATVNVTVNSMQMPQGNSTRAHRGNTNDLLSFFRFCLPTLYDLHSYIRADGPVQQVCAMQPNARHILSNIANLGKGCPTSGLCCIQLIN
ncbi:Acetylxylan esterase [Fusarium oxysporum f. sp. albedinis]|nr:Acetylxylan esterase [Fusarium oxysporum f. sp. albedinis]